MLREEYLRRLIDGAHVDLYLSANDGARIYWPWRMHPPKEASERYRDSCEVYAIDSAPLHPSVTTADVLDEGERLGAEVVSLVDYLPFEVYESELDPVDDPEDWEAYQSLKDRFDSAYEATVASVREGLEDYRNHAFDGTLLVPLQAPHAECYRAVGEPTDHWIGVGGLKDARDTERIRALREVRDAAPGVHIHGFGWGPRPRLARAIRRDPHLLDSLDYSSPVQSAPYEQSSPGDERSSVAAAYAGYQLVQDLREVSEFVDETAPTTAVAGQKTAADFL